VRCGLGCCVGNSNLCIAQNKFGSVQKLPKKWLQKCEYDMAILQNFLFTPWDNYREFIVHVYITKKSPLGALAYQQGITIYIF